MKTIITIDGGVATGTSTLAKAEDAVEIDTTYLNAGEVTQLAIELAGLPLAQRPSLIRRDSQGGEIIRKARTQ